jgi:protein SCO1/2
MNLPSVPVPALALGVLVALVASGCAAAGSPWPAATPGTAMATGAPASPGVPAAPSSAPPSAAAAVPASPADLSAYVVPGAPLAGSLALTSDAGTPFDLASLGGSPILVYFGYTHCPDVCPATTGVLSNVVRSAPALIRVVFVTVDPERDTTETLHAYLSYLPPGFIGLTGPSAAVRAAADAYGVEYERVDTASTNGDAMAHTADVFLVDAEGRLRYRFPFGTNAATILAAIAGLGG